MASGACTLQAGVTLWHDPTRDNHPTGSASQIEHPLLESNAPIEAGLKSRSKGHRWRKWRDAEATQSPPVPITGSIRLVVKNWWLELLSCIFVAAHCVLHLLECALGACYLGLLFSCGKSLGRGDLERAVSGEVAGLVVVVGIVGGAMTLEMTLLCCGFVDI